MFSSVYGQKPAGTWSSGFNSLGYIPILSETSGPIRSFIGGIGAIKNIGILAFTYFKKDENLSKKAKEELATSAGWIIRGMVESQSFIGNGVVWSMDSLFDRINDVKYKEKGFLYSNRFVPGVSLVTGAVRSCRGICATITGIAAVAFFNIKGLFSTASEKDKHDALASRKFTSESLYEIPQGLIEMIPFGNRIHPSVGYRVDLLEHKKLDLWSSPSNPPQEQH